MLKANDLNQQLLDPMLAVMNFLNELQEQFSEAISFAAGRPFESFFRVREALGGIDEYVNKSTVSHSLDALMQYGATNGLIQNELVKLLSNDEGVDVKASDVMITVGCQEAMMISVLGLCRPDRDVLLVADPCYIGITGVASLLGVEIVAVQSVEDGLDLSDLDKKIRDVRARSKRPRLLYDIPDFSNPTGVSMSLEKRHAVLKMALDHDFLILEDQAYRIFSYDEESTPSLKALDKHKRVLCLGSFAKTIFPGARVGFIVADQEVEDSSGRMTPLTEQLSKVKSLITVNTPPLNQALVASLITSQGGSLRAYNKQQIEFYRTNRDCMLACLEKVFPKSESWTKGISWNRPKGGFFLILNLPFAVDNAALDRSARDYGVLWVPMRYFYLGAGGEKQIRLSFSYVSQARIEEGIKRLGRFVKDLALAEKSPK